MKHGGKNINFGISQKWVPVSILYLTNSVIFGKLRNFAKPQMYESESVCKVWEAGMCERTNCGARTAQERRF